VFFAVCYVHQIHFDNRTPISRLALLHALAHGTFQIDAYQDRSPTESAYNGHYYSDKAPGTAATALPAFAAGALVLRVLGVHLSSDAGWLASSWMASAGSNGILAAMGAVALFAWLSKRVAPRWALVVTLALFLGAAPLPYATMMYSHAMVVGLLAIAFWALDRPDTRGTAGAPSRTCEGISGETLDMLAGFACGLALASEFTAGIAVSGLFIWLAAASRGRAFLFGAGAVAPLLLIPAYSWACFGKPFVLAYSLESSFPEMKEGVYAIKWPDMDVAINLLFTPTRGLFFWTPFLLISALGYGWLIRDNRRLFWLVYIVPALQVILISGRVWDWQAGPTLGPRLLAPAIPFFALPCALGVARFPKVGIVLAAYSILITTVATLTDACPTSGIYNPLFDLHLPLLQYGRLSPNLGTVLGLPPHVSVAAYYFVLIAGIWWIWRRLPVAETDAREARRGELQKAAFETETPDISRG